MGTVKKKLALALPCIAAVALLGAARVQSSWEAPYTPTRLEWLALECNLNHPQRYEFVHSTYLAESPNKINVVITFAEKAKTVAPGLRKDVADAAKDYVRDTAQAMHWTEPVEIETTEVFH
jgi:hypothetical protein